MSSMIVSQSCKIQTQIFTGMWLIKGNSYALSLVPVERWHLFFSFSPLFFYYKLFNRTVSSHASICSYSSVHYGAWSSGHAEGEADLEGSTFSCFTRGHRFKSTSVQRLTQSSWGLSALRTSLTCKWREREKNEHFKWLLLFLYWRCAFVFGFLIIDVDAFHFFSNFPCT